MLVRNVSHEARNGGETPCEDTCCTSSDHHEKEKKRAQEVAVWGRTEQERPRATEQLLCVHAQQGQNARGEQPGKAHETGAGAGVGWVPTIRGPTRLSKRGRQDR